MMPGHQEAVIAFRAIVYSMGFFAVLQFMLWPSMITDFRQRIFQVRHALFLYMAEGHVQPTDEAYVHLRSTLNGLIRFASRVSFMRLALGSAVMRSEGKAYDLRMNRMLSRHPPEVRQRLESLWQRMGEEIILHIRRTSPIAWLVILIFGVAKLFRAGLAFTAKARQTIVSVTEAEAVAEAHELDQAAA